MNAKIPQTHGQGGAAASSKKREGKPAVSAKAKGKKRAHDQDQQHLGQGLVNDDGDEQEASSSSTAAGSSVNVAYVPGRSESMSSFTEAFWKHQFDIAENLQEDFKTPELPLARVKRVMKTDPDIAMIASEVPVILEKACQIFISDLTARAYIDSTKRRTLTKIDVINATAKSDMFDFLIDIAPRELLKETHTSTGGGSKKSSNGNASGSHKGKNGKAGTTSQQQHPKSYTEADEDDEDDQEDDEDE